MKLNKKAIARLEAIKYAVLADPEHYDQERYNTQSRVVLGDDCGCLLFFDSKLRGDKSDSFWFAVQNISKELRLSETAGLSLFGSVYDDWPEKFRKLYRQARTPQGRARVAAARIDAYIAEHS